MFYGDAKHSDILRGGMGGGGQSCLLLLVPFGIGSFYFVTNFLEKNNFHKDKFLTSISMANIGRNILVTQL